MAVDDEERRREYPGNRFSRQILRQDLSELTQRLNDEEFGEGHLEQGHNQIELYRQNGTTVSLFVLDEGAVLPEHSVDDGSVMIQVLDGRIRLEAGSGTEDIQAGGGTVVTLQEGVSHGITATESSRLIVTIMRD
ncbi:MAG: hypothetical protein ABEK50_17095 [bacterium]